MNRAGTLFETALVASAGASLVAGSVGSVALEHLKAFLVSSVINHKSPSQPLRLEKRFRGRPLLGDVQAIAANVRAPSNNLLRSRLHQCLTPNL